MTKVYIKHNPCTVQTEIAVNGAWVLAPNKLAGFGGLRLQAWAPEFMSLLLENYPDSQYEMEFFGTQQEYNDLVAAMNIFLASNPNVQVGMAFQPSPELEEARERVYAKLTEIEEYCQSFGGKDFEEIFAKKKEIEPLPGALFSSYITRLFDACTAKENAEKAEYLKSIETLELDSVATTTKEIQNHNYSDAAKSELMLELEKRKLFCQRADLEALTAELATLSRDAIRALMATVAGKEYDRALTEEFLTAINAQNDAVEQKELETLCAALDNIDIEELKQLQNQILAGGYQQRFTDPYIARITARIEALHVRNMEQYCAIVDTVDKENLRIIKNKIDTEDCAAPLKDRFYGLIAQRMEVLDYEELCEVTEDIENRSLEELAEIYTQLENGNYNAKFVKLFLVKVRSNLDKKKAAKVEDMMTNLATMTKAEVLELSASLEALGYPDRILYIPRERITERIFELDMLELIALGNNFDSMSLNEINDIRLKVSQKDVCQRANYTYSMKLAEREKVIGISAVSQNAAYAKQLMDQMGLGEAGIVLPLYSAQYDGILEQHFADMGQRNFSEIPFLFLAEVPGFALTKNFLYYKTATGYARANITDIRLISTEKKLFSESLVITLANGAVATLLGSVSKKTSTELVNYLVTVVNNASNVAVLSQFAAYNQSVAPFSTANMGLRTLPESLNFDALSAILTAKVSPYNEKNIRCRGTESWAGVEPKIAAGMGINPMERVAFFYDRTLLNTAKDGFDLGEYYISFRNGNKGLAQIAYAEVFQLTKMGNQLSIVSTNNSALPTEFTTTTEEIGAYIVNAFNEFVCGMQMLEATPVAPVAQPIVEPQPVAPAQEFRFCTQCGTKLPIGSAFCTQCGNKLI